MPLSVPRPSQTANVPKRCRQVPAFDRSGAPASLSVATASATVEGPRGSARTHGVARGAP
jgi:hypothetical protein